MVNPNYLCRKHLLGCHLEHHMFLGALKKGKKLRGFFINNCFEPKSLKLSHDQISNEMLHRRYNHQTPISQEEVESAISNLTDEERDWCIDREASLKDLLMRCVTCGERFNHYKKMDELENRLADELAEYIDKQILQSFLNKKT